MEAYTLFGCSLVLAALLGVTLGKYFKSDYHKTALHNLFSLVLLAIAVMIITYQEGVNWDAYAWYCYMALGIFQLATYLITDHEGRLNARRLRSLLR